MVFLKQKSFLREFSIVFSQLKIIINYFFIKKKIDIFQLIILANKIMRPKIYLYVFKIHEYEFQTF